MNTDEFEYLVEYAIKAPSGHNTQPWKFENTDNGITIHPDFNRALPIVDNDNHALYISLGCALENLIIAAKQKGYYAKILYPEDANSSISISLTKENNVVPDLLFNEICKRQVTKNKYNNKSLSKSTLNQLKTCFNINGVEIKIFDRKNNFEDIIPTIIEASNLQFNNNEFIEELIHWIRFSKKEAKEKKDGIWAATTGMPGVGRILGSYFMRNLVTAKSEEKRLNELLEHSQGLAIFISDSNDVKSWVKTGQAFQRFGLTASYLQLSHSHLNMPCEEIGIRQKLAKLLGVKEKHPLLLIRYGYSERMPFSYRRNIKSVKKCFKPF